MIRRFRVPDMERYYTDPAYRSRCDERQAQRMRFAQRFHYPLLQAMVNKREKAFRDALLARLEPDEARRLRDIDGEFFVVQKPSGLFLVDPLKENVHVPHREAKGRELV